METTTLYTLAQLNYVHERYDEALRYMQLWLDKATNPGPEPHIFMGQVYYQKEDYYNAALQIEKGVAIAQGRGTAVKENWWALLTYLYTEQEQWSKVLEMLGDPRSRLSETELLGEPGGHPGPAGHGKGTGLHHDGGL